MPLIRLIYSSDARETLVYRDFMEIMTKAGEVNASLEITGMLCYGNGKFLQALEGERATVNDLYFRISSDPRHRACQLVQVEDITTRDFAEWGMKIVNWSDAASASQQATLVAATGSDRFEPDQMTGLQATNFLRGLAAAERLLLS